MDERKQNQMPRAFLDSDWQHSVWDIPQLQAVKETGASFRPIQEANACTAT